MIVGNDVGVAVLWLVDLQVGVLPRELLPGVDGLRERDRNKRKCQQKPHNEGRLSESSPLMQNSWCFFLSLRAIRESYFGFKEVIGSQTAVPTCCVSLHYFGLNGHCVSA